MLFFEQQQLRRQEDHRRSCSHPHAEILNNAVAPILEKEGYTLEVKEFTDYVQPNDVTENGDVDANYFQHGPYLENFNEEKGTHLVSVTAIHFEPMGIYSKSISDLKELKNGAKVAVPNDATNEHALCFFFSRRA